MSSGSKAILVLLCFAPIVLGLDSRAASADTFKDAFDISDDLLNGGDGYSHYDNSAGMLAWAESYIARGEVALGDARYPISLRDATADGVFEAADLDRGTMLGVDSGADSKEKFYGKGQLISLGDRRFVFDAVEPDGSALTLVESHLPIPTVGERFPAFEIRLASGSRLDLVRRRGQPLILDLWSSW